MRSVDDAQVENSFQLPAAFSSSLLGRQTIFHVTLCVNASKGLCGEMKWRMSFKKSMLDHPYPIGSNQSTFYVENHDCPYGLLLIK